MFVVYVGMLVAELFDVEELPPVQCSLTVVLEGLLEVGLLEKLLDIEELPPVQ